MERKLLQVTTEKCALVSGIRSTEGLSSSGSSTSPIFKCTKDSSLSQMIEADI